MKDDEYYNMDIGENPFAKFLLPDTKKSISNTANFTAFEPKESMYDLDGGEDPFKYSTTIDKDA